MGWERTKLQNKIDATYSLIPSVYHIFTVAYSQVIVHCGPLPWEFHCIQKDSVLNIHTEAQAISTVNNFKAATLSTLGSRLLNSALYMQRTRLHEIVLIRVPLSEISRTYFSMNMFKTILHGYILDLNAYTGLQNKVY